MKVKNKKSILFLFGLSLIFIVIGVIAYFSNSEIMQNRFISGTYKTVTRETFTSPTNWIPGQETEKSIVTKNEGTIPVRVRVKLDESWTSKNNDPLDLEYNGEKAAIINFDNESDWLKKGDYYYYLEELAPGDETSSLIKSVTYNSNVEPDILCTTSNNVYTCESTGDGYDGATYQLDITIETVQANKYREVWGSNSPIMYDYVGDNPCTFNGELVPGVEYVNGQYSYSYRQEWVGSNWRTISDDGWGVKLTDKDSPDSVTSTLCSSINNKPIVSMSGTFYESKATSIVLSSFDTSNVTDMNGMFWKGSVESLDLSSFNTSNVTTMQGMFSGSQVTSLDLSGFDTSKVTVMKTMFQSCVNLVSLDLSGWDTSKVTTMYGMFIGQEDAPMIIERIIGIENFDVSNVSDMRAMFQYCVNLDSLNLSGWDTSSVTTMHGVFFGCSSLTNLNLSNWDTSNVVSMVGMFDGCTSLTSLDLSSFNTSNVTDMSWMFAGIQVPTLDLSNFNTSNVIDMRCMFLGSQSTTLDLSSFNTSNVTNMKSMFEDCNLIQTIYVSTMWNTNVVNNSSNMFKNCTSLSGFDSTKTDASMANTNGGYLTLKSI